MKINPAFALIGIWAMAEEAAHNHASLTNHPLLEAKILASDITPEIFNGPMDICDDDDQATESDEEQLNVAIITKRGPIPQYGEGSADLLACIIRIYANDPSTCAIIIDGNTPGGEVYGTNTWREAILYARTMKPVIFYCEDGMVQSAGMWGAAACTERYAGNKLCTFGSIGMMATLIDDSKADDKAGVEVVIIYAPQSKLKNKTYQDALNGNTAPFEARLKFQCDKMLTDVATDLKGQLTTEEWNTGDTYFAEDAQRIGLINGIMSRDEVLARAIELAQNQKENNMFNFKKTATIAALAGAAPETVTAETVQAINAELVSSKIPAITVVLDSELQALSEKAENVTALEASVTGLNSQITAKDLEIAGLKEKISKIPAVGATATAAVQDAPPAATVTTEVINAKSELTSVDKELETLQAMYKLA